jgi:hypothetical protein
MPHAAPNPEQIEKIDYMLEAVGLDLTIPASLLTRADEVIE